MTAAGAHNTGSTGGLALPYHAHQSSVPTSHQASGVTRAGPLRCRGSYVETSTRPVLRWPGDLALCSDDLDLVVVVEQRGHLAGRGLVRRAARDVPAEHARGGEQQQQPEREQPSSNGEEQAWLGLGVGLG